ncbi:hypothetical protein EON66_04815 [archaeon]|nr:MAG: hypothetical protein EON66_04815 [archaeon]
MSTVWRQQVVSVVGVESRTTGGYITRLSHKKEFIHGVWCVLCLQRAATLVELLQRVAIAVSCCEVLWLPMAAGWRRLRARPRLHAPS